MMSKDIKRIFGRPFVKWLALCYWTDVLSCLCLSVFLVCLWRCCIVAKRLDGSRVKDETWLAGRPQPRPHCVRWGSSPPPKGAHTPIFGPCL